MTEPAEEEREIALSLRLTEQNLHVLVKRLGEAGK